MFQEIAPLLSNRSFNLILTGAPDGRIRVNFIPVATSKDTEQDKPLLTPLTFTGTPAELDEGFASAITGYTEAHQTMQQAVEATKKAMADAKAAAEAKAKAEAEAKKNKVKTTTVKPATPAKPAAPAAPSLFDTPDSQDDDGGRTRIGNTPTHEEDETEEEEEEEDEAEEVFEP